MYNLSPRWRRIKGRTPDDVGPNTYYLCGSNLCPQIPRRCTYPFSGTAPHNRTIRHPVYCDKFYNLPQPHVKSCTILQSKAQRFKPLVVDDGPGPTSYPNLNYSKKCRKIDPTPPEGKGKLYLCHVDLCYGVNAPSIPSKRDENGYDLDSNGRLIKIPQNEIKESVGPNEYDITRCSCCNCERYRGCFWSKSKTKRFTQTKDVTPGPGDYNLEVPKDKLQESLEEYRQMARLFSYLPRYLDEQQLLKIRENLPGPASYYPKIYKCNICPSVGEQIMITKSERFKYSTETSPGPGDYDPVYPTKKLREKCCPLSTSSRFPKTKIDDTPAPNAYDVKSPLQAKLESKLNKYSTALVPFNTTAQRKMFSTNDHPGPGDYDQNLRIGCGGVLPTYAFKSKVKRFPSQCKQGFTCPLDLDEAYKLTQYQRSHNVKKVSFNAKAVKKEHIREGPGPGEYDLFLELCNGRTVPQEYPRFKDPKFMAPGVGTYHIHPKYEESTHRARETFNIALKEKILKKKLRLSPKETYKPWCEKLKKHRQLRWFHERKQPSC